MNILILDEDTVQMPQTCDLIRQEGHLVAHVTDYRDLERTIREFKPDAYVIDLMIPAPDIPSEKCNGGYTTGTYLYKEFIRKAAPSAPFVVLSASCLDIPMIQRAITELKKYPEFRAALLKGVDEENIIPALIK